MSRRSGYSLFEVLIAFVIMTLILSALIPGQARLLGRAIAQEERMLAQDYALSRLALLDLEKPLTVRTSDETYRDWSVNTNITAGRPLSETATYQIDITVRNGQGMLLAAVETVRVSP